MEKDILFTPPFVFLIIFGAVVIFSLLASLLSFKKKDTGDGSRSSYASGEDFKGSAMQADYSQFFPFAFFFTVLHVAAMMIATVPALGGRTLVIAVVYVIDVIVGLYILLRSEN